MPPRRPHALLALKKGASAAQRRRAMAALRRRGRRGATRRCFDGLGLVVGHAPPDALRALRKHPGIERAGLIAKPLEAIVPDGDDSREVVFDELGGAAPEAAWGLGRMAVPELWAAGLEGQGVVIGHMDTGVDEAHPALANALEHRAFVDALGRAQRRERLQDTERHGTHTAGSLCGRPHDGHRVGVAPQARLAAAVVIHGGDPLLRVLGGLDWLVRLRDARVRVVNMSLGFPGSTPQFRVTMQRLRGFGILPVAAIGNDGPLRSRSPANQPEALGVGACAQDERLWPRSCSQWFQRLDDPVTPDLVAPGVDVESAARGGGYRLDTGTSMAVPQVAGLAALLFSGRPQATVDQVEAAILGSCRPLPDVDAARQGRGVPHAPTAWALLQAMA